MRGFTRPKASTTALALLFVLACAPTVTGTSVAPRPGDVQADLAGAAGFTKAMAIFDYTGALRVAGEWAAAEPQALAPALALARVNNAFADLASDPGDTEAHVVRALAALEPFKNAMALAPTGQVIGGALSPTGAILDKPPPQTLIFGGEPSAVWHLHWAEALALRARTRGTGAIVLLPEIAAHAEIAVARDGHFDDCAAMRLLGMVLVKSPPWPNGPGDLERGGKMLEEAVRCAPRRAEGYVHLADAALDQSRVQDANRLLKKARDMVGQSPRGQKLLGELELRARTQHSVKIY